MTPEICTPRDADTCRTVRLAPIPRPPVHGDCRGTVNSLVNPAAGQPAVGDVTTVAINRPIALAKGPPAITADNLAAAISAVLLLGAAIVTALLQLAVLEFGSWFNLAFPR